MLLRPAQVAAAGVLRVAASALREAAEQLRRRVSAAVPRPADALGDRVTAAERVAVAQMRPTRWLDATTPDPTSYQPVKD